jgi:hypothetical protein
MRKMILGPVLMERRGQLAEVSELVACLASTGSSSMTGAEIWMEDTRQYDPFGNTAELLDAVATVLVGCRTAEEMPQAAPWIQAPVRWNCGQP